MSIVKWAPMKEIEEMRRDMENMFREFFEPPARNRRWLGRPLEAGVIVPAIEIYGGKDEIVLKAELPGVEKDSLDLTITKDAITIKGEKKKEAEVKEEDYYSAERRYGTFARTIPLPEEVDSDKAKASLKNGVLTVVLPRKEKEKAREITVEVN
jgi:HSP20 family protein